MEFYAPTVLALATRAGESPEASTLSLPAAEKNISLVMPLTARCELTNGEVNTTAYTARDCVIDGRTSGTAEREVDNGGLARLDSMVHRSVDSTNNVGKRARPFVREHFNSEK